MQRGEIEGWDEGKKIILREDLNLTCIYIYIFSSITQPWIFLKYFNLPVFAWVWNIP